MQDTLHFSIDNHMTAPNKKYGLVFSFVDC